MSEELELSATGGDAEFDDEGDGECPSVIINKKLIVLCVQSVFRS